MTLERSELKARFERLAEEQELAISAATASNAADQYDANVEHLLRCGDPAVVAEALKRVDDATVVRRAGSPEPVEGGYGKAFGAVTVGDKARFLVLSLLGPTRGARAIAEGASARG